MCNYCNFMDETPFPRKKILMCFCFFRFDINPKMGPGRRFCLLQSRSFCADNTTIVLGKNFKHKYQAGLFILSGGIFAGIFHIFYFPEQVVQINYEENKLTFPAVNEDENNELSKFRAMRAKEEIGRSLLKSMFTYFFLQAENSATVEPILEKAAGSIPKGISAESDSQSERTLIMHLMTMGFREKDIKSALPTHEREEIDVPTIIDRILENHKRETGENYSTKKFGKNVIIKGHNTKIISYDELNCGKREIFHCFTKNSRNNRIMATKVKEKFILTSLEVDSSAENLLTDDKIYHLKNVLVASTIFAFSALLGFRARKLAPLFVNPVSI